MGKSESLEVPGDWTPPVPKFSYYLTTRGLNKDGTILSLEYMPMWFRRHVTVVSVKENKQEICNRYPEVSYWSNPARINSASAKREWIFHHSESDNFFFINDETRLYVAIGDGKSRSSADRPVEFAKHVMRMEQLANYYVGVAANQKLFSGGLLKNHSMLRENYVLGTWFYWNRKFALEKLKLNRVRYCDDVDYVLQALKLGYRVCNYAGILYAHRTTVPQRQHSDRTEEVQEEGTRNLIKFHPESITRKEGYDPKVSDIGISIKFGPSYNPKRRVVIVYDVMSTSWTALAAYLMLMKLKKNIQVLVRSLSPVATNSALSARPVLRACAKLGYKSWGTDQRQLTVRAINQADVVFYIRKADLEKTQRTFPRVPPHKYVNMMTLSGERVDRLEGTSIDQKAQDLESSIKKWIKSGMPCPSASTIATRNIL